MFFKTPLNLAIEENNVEAIKLLLENQKIDVNIKTVLNNFFYTINFLFLL